MKNAYRRKSWSLIFLLVTLPLAGQNSGHLNINPLKQDNINISSLIDRQVQYIKKSYSEKIEAPKEIINGKEYESYYRRSKSKPLLFNEKTRTATLFTPTRQYLNLNLQYDTFLDELIYTDTSRTINFRFPQIALNKDLVVGFNLYFSDGSLLVFGNINANENNKQNLQDGFYEIAYSDRSKYYIKHKSNYYQRDAMNEYEYAPENYMSVGNGFYKIKGRKSFLKLFGNKEKEVSKFMHESKIKIRKTDKEQYVRVLKFYDSLSE